MTNQKATKAATFAPKVSLTKAKGSRQLRASLLIGAFAIVMSVVLGMWVVFFQTDNNISIDLNKVTATSDGRLELQGLTYRGRTSAGDLYALSAENAQEDATDPNFVNLTFLDGTIDSQANGQITLSSDTGRFDQIENAIMLAGNVIITQSARELLFKTERLSGDFDKGNFAAPQTVSLESPTALITGESMIVTDFGDKVVFKGQSKAVITEDKKK